MSTGTGDFSATSPGYGMHSSGLNQEQLQERQEERSHHASNPITTTTSRRVSDATQSYWNTRFFAEYDSYHFETTTHTGSSMGQFSSMASASTFTGTPVFNKNRPFTFEDAIWHYRTGNGDPLYVKLNSLDFNKINTSDFNKPDFIYQGNPGKYVSFDMPKHYTNSEQALIYGTIGVVYLGNHRIMGLTDKYDFDVKGKLTPKGIFRDFATILGAYYNGVGKPFDIYFMGTTKIK